MKNQIFLFSFFMLWAFSAHGQRTFFCGYEEGVAPTDVCDFLKVKPSANQREDEEAVDEIMKQLGLSRYFMLARCPNIRNAVALSTTGGDQYIVYGEQFIQRIKGNTIDWAALSILMHEAGHHLSGHTLRSAGDMKETRSLELEADRFSGAMMYKLGATLQQAQQAVNRVASDEDDKYKSHPRLSLRLTAIEEGYNEAKEQENKPPVMVLNMLEDELFEIFFESWTQQSQAPEVSGNPDMVFVKGGTFKMGTKKGYDDEKPVRSVTVSDFYLHKNELTIKEYLEFANATNSRFPEWLEKGSDYNIHTGSDDYYKKLGSTLTNDKYPIVGVSWLDAVAYCNWRSEREGFQKVYTISGSDVTADWNASGYRLPTEAEWEYAARSLGKNEVWAGTSSEINFRAYANSHIYEDGYQYAAPVGSFRANGLGLYDMSGNVYEWCWDRKDTYPSDSQTNPRGPESGYTRVVRGGCWDSLAAHSRCTSRNKAPLDYKGYLIGFRIARSAR